jgi:hypothetical protein
MAIIETSKGVSAVVDSSLKIVKFTDGYSTTKLTLAVVPDDESKPILIPRIGGSMIELLPASGWLAEGVRKALPKKRKRGRPKKSTNNSADGA